MGLFTRAELESDKKRYQAELDRLLAAGWSEDDFLVRRQRRRIETVERLLADPRARLDG